jgi:hypothetical protein
MRSRAERQVLLERSMRAIAVAGIATLIVGALLPATSTRTIGGEGDALARALREWYRVGLPNTAWVEISDWPSPPVRDGLAAARHVGVALSWRHALVPFVVELEELADPGRGSVVRSAGGGRLSVSLTDGLGAGDTIAVSPSVTARRSVVYGSRVAIDIDGSAVGEVLHAAPVRKGVLVLGRVGWEAAFLVRALEERGWDVTARLGVAPARYVTQGRPAPLDTARFDVVFVLDATAADLARDVDRFVVQGGGVVLFADAVEGGPFLTASVARASGDVPASAGAFLRADPRAALARQALVGLERGSVVLEELDGAPAVVARRVGTGRVVQLAYRDLWRWRMNSEEPSGYVGFVSDLAAAASPRVLDAYPVATDNSAAPVASLAAALGPAQLEGPPAGSHTPRPWHHVVLAVVLTGLLVEWASRRLRTAP